LGHDSQHASEAWTDAYTGYLNDRGQPNVVQIRSYVSRSGQRSPGLEVPVGGEEEAEAALRLHRHPTALLTKRTPGEEDA
jgi:hypothetical protein